MYRPGRRSPAPAATPGDSGLQLPRTGLAGLRWSGYHGVQLPSSPAAGPHHISNGLAWGFAGLVAIYWISTNPLTNHLYNSSDRTIDALVIGSALLAPVLIGKPQKPTAPEET